MNAIRYRAKHDINRALLVVVAGFLLAWSSTSCFAGGVPVYPGAVLDTGANAQVSAVKKHALKVYLSRDSLQKVRDWYQPRLAKQSIAGCTFKDPQRGCGAFKEGCESPTGAERAVQCSDDIVLKWNYIPPGSSMVDAFNAGVHLEGWRKPPQKSAEVNAAPLQMTGQAGGKLAQIDAMSQQMQVASQQAMQQLNAEGQTMGVNAVDLASIPDMPFGGLKQEVIAGRHTQQELDAVYSKYHWLVTAFYPMQKTVQGGESYEHWLVKETRARIQAPQAAIGKASTELGKGAAAVGARLQQLIAAGRMQEAQQLAQQMGAVMQGGQQIGNASAVVQQKDHWNEWVDVIKQLAAHAYKTKIIVDTF